MDAPRRNNFRFYIAAVLLLLSLPVAYRIFLSERPAPIAPVAVPPKAPELRLGALEGAVEIRRGEGAWTAAQSGQTLASADLVRTSDGASAVIVGGDAYEVRMEPGSEISIQELTHSISRLMLGVGMATAKVKGTARHAFEVKAAGSEAVAKTQSGQFTVSNNGEGTVAVGAQEGEVELSGGGKVVVVRAGQQSVVFSGQAPTEPIAIPKSLLLKVKWPDMSRVNKRTLTVEGQVDPGAVVQMAGRSVKADAQGKFSSTVKLTEGQNTLEAQARSVGGTTAQDRKRVYVDTTGPKVGIDPDLWNK